MGFLVFALHPHPVHNHFLPPVHLKSSILQILKLLQTGIGKETMNFICENKLHYYFYTINTLYIYVKHNYFTCL